MKRTITILIAVLLTTATNLLAQQVIEFKALSAPFHILTKADVDAILDAEWNGGEFIAEIDPEITVIGNSAFAGYKYLVKANTNNVETLDTAAFSNCWALKKIELPLVTTVKHEALAYSRFNLVSIGLGFIIPTNIFFEERVFVEWTTTDYDLVISEFALPAPDLVNNIWQDYGGDTSFYPYPYPYIWKSITIYSNVEEDEEKKIILYLGNNTYYIDSDDILEFELFDLLGNQIQKYNDAKIIDINHLPTGIYFIQGSNRKRIKFGKLVRH